MQGFFIHLLILFGSILELSYVGCASTFDVTEFGALGDGRTDDTEAFESAWAAGCKNIGTAKVLVPSGRTFLVSSIKFAGPCKSTSIIFELLGTIVSIPRKAWGNSGVDQWLYFHEVDGLSVVGNGQGMVDGQGDSWWRNGGENLSPTALRFSHCTNLLVSGLNHKNSQKNHISITGCNNATISNLHIIAPEKSPNTDGIDISSSSNLHIQDCVMETGDDCIAINGGTSNVNISRITCGPGHGISIGSLGKNGKHDEVERIYVDNCTFIKTQNGVRIKSWQGGKGFARDIIFSNIIFVSAGNPVIIDQFYCPHKKCNTQVSAVKVSNVSFMGLQGTASSSKKACVSLRCSQTVPCTDIVLDHVTVRGVDGTSTTAQCTNAYGRAVACDPDISCLQT